MLRQQIMDAVDGRVTPDGRLACLVAITVASQSHAQLHPDRRQRRRIAKKAKVWVKTYPFADAVKQIVDAITAAMVAVVVVSATSAS